MLHRYLLRDRWAHHQAPRVLTRVLLCLILAIMPALPVQGESLIQSGTREWVAAATTGRADMLIIGDSVVNHSLYGWTAGISHAASTRIGLAGTGLATKYTPATTPGLNGANLRTTDDWLVNTPSLPQALQGFAVGQQVPALTTSTPIYPLYLGLGLYDTTLDRTAGYTWQLWATMTGSSSSTFQGLRAARTQTPWSRQIMQTSPTVPVAASDDLQLIELEFDPVPGHEGDWHEFAVVNASPGTAVFYNRLINPNATGITVTGWGYSGGTMSSFYNDIYNNALRDQYGRAAYLRALVQGNSGKLNVVITMGINDSNTNRPSLSGITPGYSVEAYIDNIQTQINMITADWAYAGFDPDDLSFTLPSTYQINFDQIRVNRLLSYKQALHDLAMADDRISYVEIWDNGPSALDAEDLNYIHDGVHPSREGSMLYGSIFMDQLLETSALSGDLNGDGFVGVDDLDIILANWNVQFQDSWVYVGTPRDYRADPTYDGYVGLDDLDIVLAHWNTGTPPQATHTPEPAAAALFAGSIAALIMRRKPATTPPA